MFSILVTKIITFPETEHIFQKIFAMGAEYFIQGVFSYLLCKDQGHSERRQKGVKLHILISVIIFLFFNQVYLLISVTKKKLKGFIFSSV
jgi:hypothetical protein